MWKDPIVEEVRAIRKEQAEKLNYDLKALFEHLRDRQREGKREVVTLEPRRIDDLKDAA